MSLHNNWALKTLYILTSDVDALKFWQKASTDEYPNPPDIEIEAALLRADSKQSVTADCGLL